MTDMSASVILKLVDQLTGPAKKAASTVKSLVKDLEKMQRLSGRKSSGANRQFASVALDAKKAAEAARSLNRVLSRPIGRSFAKPATTSINGVATAANRATTALQRMNRAMGRTSRSGGSGGSGGGGGGSGGRGGHGGRHSGFGAVGHVGAHVGRAVMHSGIYEAVHHGIHGTIEGIKTGFEQAFELQHTKVMLAMQGESKDSISAAVAQARKMSKAMPQFTTAQNLEAIAELRPALLGGIEEATKLAPMFQQSISVLEAAKQGAGKKAMGGVDTHGEALSLVRALEVKNVTGLGEDAMQSYVDSITKAIVAFNGQIKAEDFHSAFKFSRGDSVNWSKEFSTEILPTLMNELKKSSKTDASMTGNALKSMSRVVMSGVMTPDALAKWNGLGMLQPGAFKKSKGGKLTKNGAYHGAALVGGDVWQSNPFQWVQEYLLPHMKEKGIDVGNRKQVAAALNGLFGNRVAEHIAQILAMQQAIIKKDQQNVKKAMGSYGLNFLMGADPTTRMQVFAASLKELGGALGEIGFSGTMRGMKGMIDWAHSASEAVSKSSYMTLLGSHFDAAMAGIFGQGRGRKRFQKAGDQNYFNAGKALSAGFTRLTSSVGKMMKFWEEAGVITGTMKLLGKSFEGIAWAQDRTREGLQILGDALRSNFVIDGIKGLGLAIEGVKVSFEGMVGWLRSKFSFMFPEEAKAAAQEAKKPGLTGLRAAHEAAKGIEPPSAIIGLRARAKRWQDKAVTLEEVFAPATFGSIRPPVSGGGSSLPTFAASDGIKPKVSTEQATSQMQSLMGSLSTIAAAGVKVPVMLDMAGAEAQLNGFIARAAKIGSPSRAPQFSKALHDID